MKYYIYFFSILFLASCGHKAINIEQELYKNTEHYKITTPTATYYLEKQSGGFSSIIDHNGVDWIQYKKSDSVSVPESAAADFRGLPNLVHGGTQSGIGHPGFNICTSTIQNNNTIVTESIDGKYAFSWTFHSDFAEFNLIKADTTRKYWFLYEGTIAGKFNPETHKCFTNTGIQNNKPSIFEGDFIQGAFEWAAFTDDRTENIFYILHQTPDTLLDVIMYMGASEKGNDSEDGMVVCGFGRHPQHYPTMGNQRNVFRVGFIDSESTNTQEQYNILKEKLSNKK